MQDHLEGSAMDEHKVVFLVPTQALVEQQYNMFRKYLYSFKITNISGDANADNKAPLHKQIRLYDVFVMTPQILVDTLRQEKLWLGDLFTMIIFDECHHTKLGHPYNAIMAHYLDKKLEAEKKQEHVTLPRVYNEDTL